MEDIYLVGDSHGIGLVKVYHRIISTELMIFIHRLLKLLYLLGVLNDVAFKMNNHCARSKIIR